MANSPRGSHLFTSESVTMGHPDKISDMVSDSVLDALLEKDPNARVAAETLVTTGLVVLAGEVTVHNAEAEKVLLNIEDVVRRTIQRIGYTDPAIGFDYQSCAVLRAIHSQSADISQGVTAEKNPQSEQGAGDQGLMFGFACNETSTLMPLPIYLAHRLTERLTEAREKQEVTWLRPDGKSQVTVEYKDGLPDRIHTVVISTQHTEDVIDPATGNMSDEAKQTVIDQIIKPVILDECPELWKEDDVIFHINPTGRFVIGGPHGDAGLTGRKIIVDTYGGRGAHGGGAFSGKDPSKVDRSASYMARYIAKNIVAAGIADVCEVQLSYAIGVAKPISVLVDCEGTSKVDEDKLEAAVADVFPLKPKEIIDHLGLLQPIYGDTAHDGHFGRKNVAFPWEKTDLADTIKAAVGL